MIEDKPVRPVINSGWKFRDRVIVTRQPVLGVALPQVGVINNVGMVSTPSTQLGGKALWIALRRFMVLGSLKLLMSIGG